ncbi:MAG: hypothetical protein HY730_03645 [Candidatus Tectomicrobia bacterium]|uniref:Uncharacterized protein n=1 Tax=Tectimicrobiota bacterium TaxID=2528274 RepID=A0A933LQ93_UNCTE|nr:hypothetical protein [Candidatus Tectomicrobia bacterium]
MRDGSISPIGKSGGAKSNYLWFGGGVLWSLLAFLIVTGNFHDFNPKVMRNFNILVAIGNTLLITLFTFLLAIEEVSDEKRQGLWLWLYLAGTSSWRFFGKKALSLLCKPLLFLLFPTGVSFITWPYFGKTIFTPLAVCLALSLTALFSLLLGFLSSRFSESHMGKIGWPYLFSVIQLSGVFLLASFARPFPYLQNTLTPALWVNPLAWISELCQFDLIRWDLLYQYSSLGGYRFSYPPLGFSLSFLSGLVICSFLLVGLTTKMRPNCYSQG